MRHAPPFAQILLATPMTLSPLRRALVTPSGLPPALSIAQLAAVLFAVTLPPVVPDAHAERPAAVEAGDLDEIDLVCAHHAAAKRLSTRDAASGRLYMSRGRASASLRRLARPFQPERPGISASRA